MSSLQKRFALSVLAICLVVFSPMFVSAQIDGLPDGGNPDAVAPSGLSYTNNQSYQVGTAITTLSPTFITQGGATLTFGSSPTLPAGLSINSSTGAITGTPTTATAAANYTITATNSVGNCTFVLNIVVIAVAPSGLSYTNNQSYPVGTAITTLSPTLTSTGGSSIAYSATLPAGLSINPSSGNITGTPTTASAAANYTITATNAVGSTTFALNVTVTATAPSGLSYTNNQSYPIGTAIFTLSPTLTSNGGTTVTYSATLPAGLSINSSTGAITGTPTAVTAAANYTITATNSAGNTTFALNIAVVAIVPTSPLGVSATNGDTQANISYTAPTSDGGSPIIDYTITAIPASGSNIVKTGVTANPYIFTGLTNGVNYTFTVAARNSVGTGAASVVSNSVRPSSSTVYSIIGGVGSWSAGVPINNSSQNVEIAGNLSYNSLTACNNFIVDANVTFTTTATININGDLTNNGTIAGTGTMVVSDQTTPQGGQNINGAGTVNNITINNSLGVTVASGSNKLNITGSLNLQNGTLTTNGNVTLKSLSLANTGVLAPYGVSGNTGTISGNVTVERYIPKGFRAYRDIAPEVYGAGTIFKNWQLNGATTPGYGIFITGPTAYAGSSNAGTTDANGFDKSATSAYNTQDYTFVNGTWTPFTSTSTNLDPFTGYRVLVRGDRTANMYTSPVTNTQAGLAMFNATTLSATGQLVTGTVTYNTVANGGVTNTATGGNTSVGLNATTNGFSLVANPYVAPVQWGTGTGSNSATTTVYGASSSINGSYWYLDPTSSATGKYIAFNALTGAATVSGSGTYSNTGTVPVSTGYIQPGQAVFVQTTGGSPTVVFQETAKAISSTKASVFGTASLSKIYISLLKQTTTGYSNVDGAAVAFNSSFGNKVYGAQDAIKFSGANDNLYISDKGKSLSIDGRLPATASDAISLKMSSPTATAYQLSIDASNYTNNGFEPLLYDAFKNTTKSLGTGTTTISFTVDANNAATFSNRFTILFAPSALPVNSIVASASLSNKVATITWNTVGEKNVAAYEVEKSADAKNFTAIEKVTAKNTATANYNTTDNSVTATTYYRIKAISTAGSISYSNVAKLTYNVQLTTYSLYPNPLKGKTLNVEMGNVASGKYIISIYNALGQRVITQTISHTGGSATHAINIDNVLAAGVYSVTICEANSKQVVHQTNLSVQP